MAVQCRLCALFFCKLNPMIIFDRGLLAKIKDLTGIWLRDEEHLPRHICPSCVNELNIFTDLRQSIQRNHNRLKMKKETISAQDLESQMSSTDSEEDWNLGESEESYDIPKVDNPKSKQDFKERKLSSLEEPASVDLDDIYNSNYDSEPEKYNDDWSNLNSVDDPDPLKAEDHIEASSYKQKLFDQDSDAHAENMFSPKKSKVSKSKSDAKSVSYEKWKPLKLANQAQNKSVSKKSSKNIKKAFAETSVGTENITRGANLKYPKEGKFIQIETKMLLYKTRSTYNTKKKHPPLNLENEYD
ncbi:uncharacterized protein [Drosophila takahashii]|uniref:uncharacterized protein n=1 Tax=Drosophila takahashii TaxID=29030 RepID=UPI00389940C5